MEDGSKNHTASLLLAGARQSRHRTIFSEKTRELRLLRRSSFLHPKPILLVCRIGDDKSPSLLVPAHPPFVGFGMSIRKGKAAAQIVIRPGNVVPHWTFHPETKSSIVDVRYVFVQQHPQHGRARGINAGKLAIGGPRCVPMMTILIDRKSVV